MGKPFDIKINWLQRYALENVNYFDVLNTDLEDKFIEEFHSKQKNKEKALGVFLSEAYKRGFLLRRTIGLPGEGGSNWIYGYSLKSFNCC